MTAGDSKAALTITPQPALAPSPQPRPAPTARALPPGLVAQVGQNWTPIVGQNWMPIDTLALRRCWLICSGLPCGRTRTAWIAGSATAGQAKRAHTKPYRHQGVIGRRFQRAISAGANPMTSATPIRWSCGSHSRIAVWFMWRPLASTAAETSLRPVLTASDAKNGEPDEPDDIRRSNVNVS